MKKSLILALMLIGFTSVTSQILLIRELLVIFSGNELCLGVIIANWLVLVALGSYFLGRRADKVTRGIETFALFQILISFILPLIIYASRIIRNMLGICPGEAIGLFPVFYTSFLILSPLCLILGAQFAFGCKIYSLNFNKTAISIGRVYVYETIGAVAAGPIFTYLLVHYFHSLEIAFGVGIINLVSATILLRYTQRKFFRFKISPLRALVIVLFFLNLSFLLFGGVKGLHQRSINSQWRGYKVKDYQNSLYGNLVVIEKEEQISFCVNGVPISSVPVPDIVFLEELAHFSLLSHPLPQKVLLIGGGIGGLLDEILKHPIDQISYVEMDPLLIKIAQKHLPPSYQYGLNNPKVRVEYIDGRFFLMNSEESYDLIILNLPSPSTLQLNRFYTVEFFKMVRKRLNQSGIFVLGVPASQVYMAQEMRTLNRCIYESMGEVFPSLRVIPAEASNFFLASSTPGGIDLNPLLLSRRLEERGLKSRLINKYYLEYILAREEKMVSTIKETDSEVKINRDFHPIGTYYNLVLWNSLFYPSLKGIFGFLRHLRLWWFIVLLGVLILIFIIWRGLTRRLTRISIPVVILTTGLAGMIFNLALIFAFQVLYGYVYQKIGLMIASFMLGLAGGAMVMNYYLPRMGKDLLKYKNLHGFRGIFAACRSLLIARKSRDPNTGMVPRYFLGRIELIFVLYSLLVPFVLLIYAANPFMLLTTGIVLFILIGITGFLVGLEFPLANKIYLKGTSRIGRTAGTLYFFDLVGASIGAIGASTLLIPILGILKVSFLVVGLKLASLVLLKVVPRE